MKVLIDHFNNTLDKHFPFKSHFNSHHRNILRTCKMYTWSDLLPIYEATKSYGFISYAHRVQVVAGERTITIPKKLSDQINTIISVYFRMNEPRKPLVNQCANPNNVI